MARPRKYVPGTLNDKGWLITEISDKKAHGHHLLWVTAPAPRYEGMNDDVDGVADIQNVWWEITVDQFAAGCDRINRAISHLQAHTMTVTSLTQPKRIFTSSPHAHGKVSLYVPRALLSLDRAYFELDSAIYVVITHRGKPDEFIEINVSEEMRRHKLYGSPFRITNFTMPVGLPDFISSADPRQLTPQQKKILFFTKGRKEYDAAIAKTDNTMRSIERAIERHNEQVAAVYAKYAEITGLAGDDPIIEHDIEMPPRVLRVHTVRDEEEYKAQIAAALGHKAQRTAAMVVKTQDMAKRLNAPQPEPVAQNATPAPQPPRAPAPNQPVDPLLALLAAQTPPAPPPLAQTVPDEPRATPVETPIPAPSLQPAALDRLQAEVKPRWPRGQLAPSNHTENAPDEASATPERPLFNSQREAEAAGYKFAPQRPVPPDADTTDWPVDRISGERYRPLDYQPPAIDYEDDDMPRSLPIPKVDPNAEL